MSPTSLAIFLSQRSKTFTERAKSNLNPRIAQLTYQFLLVNGTMLLPIREFPSLGDMPRKIICIDGE